MKIGITIDMSKAFWVNGMQQNIVFLHELLKQEASNDVYYITPEKPKHILNKKHKGIILEDLLSDPLFNFDVLIVAGIDLLPEHYEKLKLRNSDLKIILVHFGNKLMDDIHFSVSEKNPTRLPIMRPKYLSQVWISPHHKFAKEYIKAYYNLENVQVCPYIWDPFLLESEVNKLKKKSLSPFFNGGKSRNICIFEPNISHIKNCIIPLMICEKFEQRNPDQIESINSFSCEDLRENKYFKKLMSNLDIVNKGDLCFFNNRWGSLNALSRFGKTIISHQINNELNYSHLEALYMGLPLIHNSPELQEFGYYYPDFDISMGANQLMSSFLNHDETLQDYMLHSREFLKKYSPKNDLNIYKYCKLINEIK